MSRLSIDKVKNHFRSKGFEPWEISDIYGQTHTLDLFAKVAGESHIVMSFKVEGRRVDTAHLVEVVRRYAAGAPCVHPWTGRIEKYAVEVAASISLARHEPTA
jgi:hypothetical protein